MRRYFTVLAALLTLLSLVMPAQAATFEDLVGRWTVETRENETFNGEPYNIRRQIEENRADGTKTVTFRFYDDCRLIGELINHGRWGVTDKVQWIRCTSIVQSGQTHACETLSEYPITAVSRDKVAYYSRGRGTRYEVQRVDDSFTLPVSACLTQAPAPRLFQVNSN